jgi:hypothetical protein
MMDHLSPTSSRFSDRHKKSRELKSPRSTHSFVPSRRRKPSCTAEPFPVDDNCSCVSRRICSSCCDTLSVLRRSATTWSGRLSSTCYCDLLRVLGHSRRPWWQMTIHPPQPPQSMRPPQMLLCVVPFSRKRSLACFGRLLLCSHRDHACSSTSRRTVPSAL